MEEKKEKFRLKSLYLPIWLIERIEDYMAKNGIVQLSEAMRRLMVIGLGKPALGDGLGNE